MKTIKLKIILSTFIVFLIGCNSKNNNQEVLKKDSTKIIVKKSNSTKKHQLENCNCEESPKLKDYISCEETVFSNGAKIYRQYNCDSSWVVFQNKNLKKNIYSLEKELVEYTHKLGYIDWIEFKGGILMYNKTASGGFYPMEFVLLDKNSGNIIVNLRKGIFLGESFKNPFLISLNIEKPMFNVFNLDTKKSAKINFDFARIDNTMKLNDVLYPELLFDDGSVVNGVFKIKYRYKLKENDEWKFENIVIDLDKVQFY